MGDKTLKTRRIIRTVGDLDANHWIARQARSDMSMRPYAEDTAVSEIVSVVQQAIDDAGIKRADIARLLGVSRSHVSQLLSGRTNMTLKTLGALLWACGRQVADLRTEPVGGDSPVCAQPVEGER